MQYLIPYSGEPVAKKPIRKRAPRTQKKPPRPPVENGSWPQSMVDRIPQEALAMCEQVRSELSKLESYSGRRSQLFRATQSLVKPGAARIFRQLARNGNSIDDLAKKIRWSPQRSVRLVSGEEAPRFYEIPDIATALKIPVPVLLAAYGYPKDTFQCAEAMAQAVLIEAERP